MLCHLRQAVIHRCFEIDTLDSDEPRRDVADQAVEVCALAEVSRLSCHVLFLDAA
jgi:hypothetical protein